MLVEARQVSTTYRIPFQAPVSALSNVSFKVVPGEVIGILGRNGAGKTTLLRLLLGLMHPDNGLLQVMGVNPARERYKILRRCGAMLNGQRSLPPRWTPNDLLQFTGASYGLPHRIASSRADELLRQFDLYDVRQRTLMSFSKGMKQKLALCMTLLHDPDLLILDEPTAHLDVETTHDLIARITDIATKKGRSVILTSHQLNVIESVANRVMVIHQGQTIFLGSCQELIARVGRGQVRIHFETLPVDCVTWLPHGIRLEQDYLLAPSDETILAELFKLASQYGLHLRAIEQTLDFENAFLALTRGDYDLPEPHMADTA